MKNKNCVVGNKIPYQELRLQRLSHNCMERPAEVRCTGQPTGEVWWVGEGLVGTDAVPTAICLFINYLASKANRSEAKRNEARRHKCRRINTRDMGRGMRSCLLEYWQLINWICSTCCSSSSSSSTRSIIIIINNILQWAWPKFKVQLCKKLRT